MGMAGIDAPRASTSASRLVAKATAALAFGAAVWFLLTNLTDLSPPVVSVATVAGGLMILVDREVRAALASVVRELRTERALESVLGDVPAGWRVFDRVDLGRETVDHVIVGRGGAFAIGVITVRDRAAAEPWGVVVDGTRNEELTVDASRRAYRLGLLLELDVQPLIVVVGKVVGDHSGRVRVVAVSGLVDFLNDQPQVLPFDAAQRAWSRLSAVTA
jgi:hypothetical protein